MKALQVVIYLLLTSNLIGQITVNDLKGQWVVIKHQSTSGPNDSILMITISADKYLETTLNIDNEIFFLKSNSKEQPESFSAIQNKCELEIKKIEEIQDIDNYLFNAFKIRTIQLGLENAEKRMMIITTTCEDELFDQLYYFSSDLIGLHELGMFFILKRK